MTEPFAVYEKALKATTQLTTENVQRVFTECLADPQAAEGDPTIEVEGIMHTWIFNGEAIEAHDAEISAMLAKLPTEFQSVGVGGGGGWSFLNMCYDRDGNQWTGLHLEVERLVMLGIAAGKATFQMPRGMWEILPGGMPYIVVDPAGLRHIEMGVGSDGPIMKPTKRGGTE